VVLFDLVGIDGGVGWLNGVQRRGTWWKAVGCSGTWREDERSMMWQCGVSTNNVCSACQKCQEQEYVISIFPIGM
jgi:hypothetical protein